MKSFLRLAAVTVASTALVAGMSTAATAEAPASTKAAPVASSVAASNVSIAVAPYPLDYKSKIRVQKRGKKLTFRLTARYRDDAGNPVGIRRATIQVLKKGKWRTLKHVHLKSNGTGKYKRSDGKKRKYRMLIKPTSLYQGGQTRSVKI
jgi:hypothetical protein